MQSYCQLEESDLSVIKNPKLFLMILLYLHGTKDSLYNFLACLNKEHGVSFLQKHYHIIDKFVPMKHNERMEIEPVTTIN